MASRQLEDVEMARKRHTAEEIVGKLRQVDMLTAQGRPVAEAVRAIGVSEVRLRDELLDGEVSYSLAEAKIVIERRRLLDLPPWSGGAGSERHAAWSMVIPSMLARASAGVR
jgi:hypothetical protein